MHPCVPLLHLTSGDCLPNQFYFQTARVPGWSLMEALQTSSFSSAFFIDTIILEFRALRAPPSSSCRGLWGPSGPSGGLQPPVGLQCPNFKLQTLKIRNLHYFDHNFALSTRKI